MNELAGLKERLICRCKKYSYQFKVLLLSIYKGITMQEPRIEIKAEEKKHQLTLTTGNLGTAARISKELYWYVINSDATILAQIDPGTPAHTLITIMATNPDLTISIVKAALAYLQSVLIQETTYPNRPQSEATYLDVKTGIYRNVRGSDEVVAKAIEEGIFERKKLRAMAKKKRR